MGLHKGKREMHVVLGEDGDGDEDEFESRREDLRTGREDRDLQHMNTHLQIAFEDVIGEPSSAHSFDGIWVGTHATFELTKYVFYKLLTTLLALPISFAGALLFALLSCVHIWAVVPAIQSFSVVLPSLRTTWMSCVDVLLVPLSRRLGRCVSALAIKLGLDESPEYRLQSGFRS